MNRYYNRFGPKVDQTLKVNAVSSVKRWYGEMEFVELILVPKVDSVVLRAPHHADLCGTLCITGHHLILSSRHQNQQELWVTKLYPPPLSCLSSTYSQLSLHILYKFLRNFYVILKDFPKQLFNICSIIYKYYILFRLYIVLYIISTNVDTYLPIIMKVV